MNRRDFMKGASLGVAYLAAGDPIQAIAAEDRGKTKEGNANSYKYRVAFDIWLNDVRLQPSLLENWPAPQFDDETVESLIRAMDVQSEAGYSMVDIFGLTATRSFPPDIASAFADKERSSRAHKVLRAAKDRGLKIALGLGTYSWGYEAIIKNDPSVAAKTQGGDPSAFALCDANPKSFEYVKKILDYTLSEFDFGGVHLESADQGFCRCSECAGKYGLVGYNTRINAKTADYIKSKWPDKLVYSITLGWRGFLNAETIGKHFTEEDKAHVIELSKHVDCIMDQGHAGYDVNPTERRDFIKKLHCAYGTSGKLWMYPGVPWNRDTYFLPYVTRAGAAIKEEYEDGVRGSLYYQGPVNNAGTEAQIAVAGRILSDTSRTVEDALGEVIELYYKPKTSQAQKQLVGIFQRAEESYFGNWPRQADLFKKLLGRIPGEFVLGPLGPLPGPATYLKEPMLDAKGRQEYKKGLISILKELPSIEGSCRDGGRIQNIRRSASNAISMINTVAMCLDDS